MAFILGRDLDDIKEMSYEEYAGWSEYFRRRPMGWREDNRSAIIAMAMGGSGLKPEKLFPSLKAIQDESRPKDNTFAKQFLARFAHRFTEKLPDDNNQD